MLREVPQLGFSTGVAGASILLDIGGGVLLWIM